MKRRGVAGVLLGIGLGAPVAAGQIEPAALADLPPADVVILGEIHDNPEHHVHQATAVAALQPRALVFEMLEPEQAARLGGVGREDAAELERLLGWEGSGWPDFSYYHPIFAAAPEASVFGGALPRAEVRRSVTEGAAAVFGPQAGLYGLDAPLDPADQDAREIDQAEAHCNALPEALLPGMVEAQRLRDAALARAVITAHAETGGPVAVITGSGHARRDQGIPAVLAHAAPSLRVLSVGMFETDPGPSPPFDLWLVTAPAQRPDPCAAFGAAGAPGGG
jgi:uncharacterized iron-regulated protein